MTSVVVIGAGECGATVVKQLRSQGFKGDITLVGDEAEAPYERPPISKRLLTDRGAFEPPTVLGEVDLEILDVQLMSAVAATAIDRAQRRVVLADGGELRYDRLVITTGARARLLEIDGAQHALTLRTVANGAALRPRFAPGARVVIIGAGLIGLELAASARRRGSEVTVLEAGPRALGRAVPAQLASAVVDHHRKHGNIIRFETTVHEIQLSVSGYKLELSSGVMLQADVVVAGVGAVPNIELAEAAGLEIENGIKTDQYLRSSDPDIFAAGDCCSFLHELYGGRRLRLESQRNALGQGAVAARNVLGANTAYDAVPWFWSDQFEMGLQVAGLSSVAETEVVRHRKDGALLWFGLAGDGRIVAAAGLGRESSVGKDVRLGQLLIERSARPQTEVLRDPLVPLKSLLSDTRACTHDG